MTNKNKTILIKDFIIDSCVSKIDLSSKRTIASGALRDERSKKHYADIVQRLRTSINKMEQFSEVDAIRVYIEMREMLDREFKNLIKPPANTHGYTEMDVMAVAVKNLIDAVK